MDDLNPRAEIAELRLRLEEAEETLRAIREGAVDAFVVSETSGERVYTLEGADRPYRLLVEVMFSAKQKEAGFKHFRLIVQKSFPSKPGG